MVCDDEQNMGFIVKRMLEREGLNVVEVRDGHECLERIKETKPDLLLLDIMMPEMSGWQVLKALRSDEELRGTPVAILSVLPFTPTMLHERDLEGVVDYIVKPFTYQELTGAVNRILKSIQEVSNLKELLADVDAETLDEYWHSVTAAMLHARLLQFLQKVVENKDRYRLPEDIESYRRVVESERKFVASCEEKVSGLKSRLVGEYYRKTLSSANIGISIKTRPGAHSFHSRYFDIPIEGSAIGRNCYNPAYEGQTPCELCPAAQSIEDGKTHSSEIEVEDGKVLNIIAVPIKNPDGTYSALELITDVTDKQKRVQELVVRNVELEEALKLKELFIDIMRHDILNPLGVVNGAVEYLELETSPENIAEIIGVIRRSCAKIEDLVENARTYSKLETIEIDQFAEKDLSDVIEECIEAVSGEAGEKGIALRFTTPGSFPAYINPLLSGVFTNLLSNAVKYSPNGSAIEVRVEGELRSWKVSIKDQGDGIPDEYKNTIFERFKRGDRGGVKGTGLGLAIASKIAEIHRGRVWVEDNPAGRGSIFYVTLPKRRF